MPSLQFKGKVFYKVILYFQQKNKTIFLNMRENRIYSKTFQKCKTHKEARRPSILL